MFMILCVLRVWRTCGAADVGVGSANWADPLAHLVNRLQSKLAGAFSSEFSENHFIQVCGFRFCELPNILYLAVDLASCHLFKQFTSSKYLDGPRISLLHHGVKVCVQALDLGDIIVW